MIVCLDFVKDVGVKILSVSGSSTLPGVDTCSLVQQGRWVRGTEVDGVYRLRECARCCLAWRRLALCCLETIAQSCLGAKGQVGVVEMLLYLQYFQHKNPGGMAVINGQGYLCLPVLAGDGLHKPE